MRIRVWAYLFLVAAAAWAIRTEISLWRHPPEGDYDDDPEAVAEVLASLLSDEEVEGREQARRDAGEETLFDAWARQRGARPVPQ